MNIFLIYLLTAHRSKPKAVRKEKCICTKINALTLRIRNTSTESCLLENTAHTV